MSTAQNSFPAVLFKLEVSVEKAFGTRSPPLTNPHVKRREKY
jgi:hypothetical protein